jgi:hypothetical protein
MGEFFDALYQRFVLRDLFSKIVPGSIAICSFLVFCPDVASRLWKDLPLGLWILLYAIAWLVGLAMQYLGEKLKLITFHTYEGDEQYRRNRLKAHRVATQRESQELERYLVIKEATGIAAVSVFLLTLSMFFFLLTQRALPCVTAVLEVVPLALLGVLLVLMNRHIAKVECDFTETVGKVGPMGTKNTSMRAKRSS